MQPKLTPDRLLAKSVEGRWRGSYSLVGHTADVVRAVTLLIEELGEHLLKHFDLDADLEELKQTARLAAYLHDWGKANNHFQGVVRQNMPNATPKRLPMKNPQLLRHEAFSIILAWEFREWLEQADGDFMTALVVAGGHHLKLGGKAGKRTDEVGEIRCQCGDDRLFFYPHHPDFKRLLRFGVKQLECPPKLKLSHQLVSEWPIPTLKERRRQIWDGFCEWEENPVLTAVLKALLVAGDAMGSAIATTEIKLDGWIHDAIHCTLAEEEIDRVIAARLQGKGLRNFQRDLGKISARVGLARAGCGTGKTVGAYNWAKRHAIGRKLFFCYPTTGTSTEGYLDYAHGTIPESELMHSRKAVDKAIAGIAATGEEVDAGDETVNEAELKLDSFKAWKSKLVVGTVDTVLGLMQCHRRPMYSFPAIANAAFVFDEVHCYDKALFGALLRFLETVKAPVLLMSASFLPSQLEAIAQAVGEPLEIIEGAQELEEQPRYRFHYAETPNWDRVEEELSAAGKVLWVCNQVSTAVGVYQEADRRGLKALLYHSRFRYQDRVRHHRKVVDAFKPDCNEAVLAIATQVAEMSLDLSATLLVSQIAQPAALIQRLGRLNRRYCGRSLDGLFYPDPKGQPYSVSDRQRGLAMIQEFSGDVSQADLARWLERDNTHLRPETGSVLLDGAWRTYPGLLRQGGVTITSLLEPDRAMFEKERPSQLNLYTVPLLADPEQVGQWHRYKGYPVAPQDQWSYSSQIGAVAIKRGRGGNK